VTSGIQDAVGLAIDRLTPLSDRVGTVLTYFDELLISSSILLLFLVIGFVFSIQGLESDAFIFQKIRPKLVLFVMMAFGLAFCILTVFPVVCFIRIIATAKNLPSWARVGTGEVSKLCSGAMTCAVLLTLLSAWTAWCRHDLVS